jgi:hypothetical protein
MLFVSFERGLVDRAFGGGAAHDPRNHAKLDESKAHETVSLTTFHYSIGTSQTRCWLCSGAPNVSPNQ